MGVPRLFLWLINTFPRHIKEYSSSKVIKEVDYLYLDSNGMLHNAAQKVFNYGSGKRILYPYKKLTYEQKIRLVYENYFDTLRKIVKMIPPKKVLYIALDGTAPIAKQNQQRERRFISSLTRNSECEFDSCSITPGTVFMQKLSRFMNSAISREIHNGKWKFNVIFSSPNTPSEGEHKLLDYARALPEEERMKSSHCLFGPDGDLIMLSMSLHIPNMFLFREDVTNVGKYHLVDIGKICTCINDLFKGNCIYDDINDFVLMGIFVGNDFLPKIQMFSLLEDGINFMINSRTKLSKNGKLLLKGIQKFIKSISKFEEEFLIDQITTTVQYKQPPSEKFVNQTLKKHVCLDDMTIDYASYRKDYYEKEFGTTNDINIKVKKMCRDYLRTIVWIYKYYTCKLPDWKWSYRYHYPPLMKDFCDFLFTLNKKEFNKLCTFELNTPNPPFVQLLCVLPYSSKNLLPEEYQCIFDILYKNYSTDFKIDYEGKFMEYQGVAIIPFINFDEVYDIYNKIKPVIKYTSNQIKNKIVLF